MIFSRAYLWDKMKAVLLCLGSVLLTAAVMGNAYYQKKQFYPFVVHITKSNPSMAVIYIQAFVLVLMLWKVMRKLFFGQLRAAETEHLIERSWYAVTETCLAFTVFRDDFSPKFVALFTLLLFLKCFHWLAEDRVDYMERSPIISWLFHFRVASLLLVLAVLDYMFVSHAYQSTVEKGASVQLVFGFEYAILLITVQNIFIKYVLHTYDLQSENPWENKAVFLLYSELIMGFCKVVLYLSFMVIMIKIHTFPLFAIRPMYLSMRAFKKAVNDVIMSRRAIRNMNTLYPDATPEELATVDNVCIICREEMTGGASSKKLPCNHIFHASCLRSWFQRQQTCPTCRMDVLRVTVPPGGASAAHAREAAQQQQQAPPQPQMPNMGNWAGFGPGGAFPFFLPPMPQPPPQPAAAAAAAAAAAPPPPQQQPPTQSPPTTQAPTQPQTSTASTSQQQQAPTTPRSTPNVNAPPTFTPPPPPPTAPASGGPAQAPGQPPTAPPFIPPFAFMPLLLPPPPPIPAADLSSLSPEELQALEGQERENLEARIRCLRNIQTLLDGAVMQMQQYSSVVASMRAASSQNNSSQASQSNISANHSRAESSTPTVNGVDSSSSHLDSKAGAGSADELRRRRLERFQLGEGGQMPDGE